MYMYIFFQNFLQIYIIIFLQMAANQTFYQGSCCFHSTKHNLVVIQLQHIENTLLTPPNSFIIFQCVNAPSFIT